MTAMRRRSATRPNRRRPAAPTLGSLLAVARTHHPDADTSPIQHAHDEAAVWHEGQTRRSGDPLLSHCLAVAVIVAGVGMPPPAICAALLHDVVDTPCPPGRVSELFGQDVADLIWAVRTAELSAIPLGSLTFDHARPAVQPTHEEAVLAIRLADRLHNMQTIAFLAPAKQYRKARETIDVLVPLARSAGLTDVSRELHDLSAAVLRPTTSASAVAPRLLTLLTLLLPAPQRARWQEEWHAELATLPTRRTRIRFTFRVLLGAPSLSLTLRRPACRERR
ncbi:HD domain-containing protein [Streptomyces cyaneochromogenes]|uniref:HD domain-containing protein n=1 Tax=Streptomyces cyaneochromogenes TaxID=2496836 RepID=A0A3S9LZB9_9ACTN|nr:HD domain-containing protein [Streptomyces cyaneochromogenes]